MTLTQTTPICWWYQTRDYRHHKHKRAERQANLYDVLAIAPKATQTQIKAADYKLSKIYHPDLNQGSKDTQEKFAAISEAYSVLGNVTLRRRYDRGIFTPRDLHSEIKEKHKETESKQRRNTSVYYNTAGERMYDFDEFYKAHYGEALRREQRERKDRKRRAEEAKKEQEQSQTPVWIVAGLSSTVLLIATWAMRRI